MAREYSREEQLDALAHLTAMVTLALDGDRKELDRYVASLTVDGVDIAMLLQSAVALYAEAFARLGGQEGFDAKLLTRRIALRESCERWGVLADD
jgi:hypothetical protein